MLSLTKFHKKNSIFTDPNSSSPLLKCGKVTVMHNNDCRRTTFFYDGLLCAKTDYGQSTCLGDSGGPLVYYSANGTPVIIGIASYTTRPLSSNMATCNYFTRVTSFYDWIKKKTQL